MIITGTVVEVKSKAGEAVPINTIVVRSTGWEGNIWEDYNFLCPPSDVVTYRLGQKVSIEITVQS